MEDRFWGDFDNDSGIVDENETTTTAGDTVGATGLAASSYGGRRAPREIQVDEAGYRYFNVGVLMASHLST